MKHIFLITFYLGFVTLSCFGNEKMDPIEPTAHTLAGPNKTIFDIEESRLDPFSDQQNENSALSRMNGCCSQIAAYMIRKDSQHASSELLYTSLWLTVASIASMSDKGEFDAYTSAIINTLNCLALPVASSLKAYDCRKEMPTAWVKVCYTKNAIVFGLSTVAVIFSWMYTQDHDSAYKAVNMNVNLGCAAIFGVYFLSVFASTINRFCSEP